MNLLISRQSQECVKKFDAFHIFYFSLRLVVVFEMNFCLQTAKYTYFSKKPLG